MFSTLLAMIDCLTLDKEYLVAVHCITILKIISGNLQKLIFQIIYKITKAFAIPSGKVLEPPSIQSLVFNPEIVQLNWNNGNVCAV